ncbi:MAG: hypothetical protein ABIQ95_06640 [Bdellovibrionia bacterium]
MTASDAAETKDGKLPDTPDGMPGQSEIDRIMNEIGELQNQMASLSTSEGSAPDESPSPAKTSDESEISELFKHIEGGEASLLAETMADVSAKTEENAPSNLVAETQNMESEIDSAVHEDQEANGPNESTISKVTTQMKTPQKENPADNSLSMTVSGQMSLKLNFEVDGQEILVHFDSDMIFIQFSEGTEFKIPLKRAQLPKAA